MGDEVSEQGGGGKCTHTDGSLVASSMLLQERSVSGLLARRERELVDARCKVSDVLLVGSSDSRADPSSRIVLNSAEGGEVVRVERGLVSDRREACAVGETKLHGLRQIGATRRAIARLLELGQFGGRCVELVMESDVASHGVGVQLLDGIGCDESITDSDVRCSVAWLWCANTNRRD